MVDLFREVDDALQQEKLERFWHENAKYILTLILAVIVGTALWSTYNYWRVAQAEQSTSSFMEIVNAPLNEENLLSVETVEENYPSFTANQKALAHFYIAQRALSLDDTKLAFSHMIAVTELSSGVNSNLKNVAAYYARNMILNGSIMGSLDAVKIEQEENWTPLFTIQNSLTRHHTAEEYDETIKTLDSLLAEDSTVPSEVQKIAEQLKHVYSYEHNRLTPAKGDKKS
jgi:hypothetical protein